MAKDILAYKTLRRMLEEIEPGRKFGPKLRKRCFREVFFEDLEKILSGAHLGKRLYLNTEATYATSENYHLPLTRRYPLAIAASISLLIVAFYFSIRLFLPNEVQTSTAEFKRVDLPDHSSIVLNANSSVKYNPISWYWERKVYFEGEGFFEVEKGSRFEVETSKGTVSVLGTSFNINQRGNIFKVDCKTGKVEVNSHDQKIILEKGETAKLNMLIGELEKNKNEKEYIASWKEGNFYFDSEDLYNVAREFERHYGVNITLNVDKNYLFTGYFSMKDLENSLETVCSALGLEYRVKQVQNKNPEIIIE